MNRRQIASVVGACIVSSVLAGGIALAAIPGDGGVISGCYGKYGGVVRVIDPAKNQKCLPNVEVPLTWNQTGPQGVPGAPGPAGPAGTSPTVTQLDRGDARCPTGGALLTDAAGTTAAVCNGADGAAGTDGTSFDGSFTSPNGQYSIAVSDTGIVLTDVNGGSVRLTAGAVQVEGLSLTASSATGTAITSGSTTSITSGIDTEIVSGRDTSITTGRNLSNTTGGSVQTDVQGAVTESVGGDTTTSNGGDVASTVGGTLTVSTGQSVTVDSGGALTAQAATSAAIGTGTTFTVDAAGNALVQSSAGVTIRASGILRLVGGQIIQN